MEKLNRKEAFSRAVAAFGDWRSWGRWEHLAYGLIRGVPYAAMERYSNDTPSHYCIAARLLKLGAWPESKVVRDHVPEVEALVVWVRKPPRGLRERPERAVEEAAAGG